MRKTKKEKILAEYHRKLQALTAPAKVVIPTASPSKILPAVADYSYVTMDLKRIGVITLLAICAQLVLWLTVGKYL